MKKLLITVCIALSSMATLGQWVMMQSQITPQQIDALFAMLPPERRQAGIVGYWQDVVNAARSGNIVRQQSVISIAPIIHKYDSQYQEHLHAAMQVAAFMSVYDNMGGGQSSPCNPKCSACGGTGRR